MTQQKDDRLYRPSWSDRGALCIHNEPLEKDTEATRNGDLFHKTVAHFIKHRKVETQLAWAAANQVPLDMVKQAQIAADSALAAIPDLRGVESEIHIYDVTNEEITWGTADVWGFYYDGRLKLKDWKTGIDHGYRYQMAHYALGLMDQEKQAQIDVEESYVATGKVKRYTLKYEEAAALVNEIYEAVLDKKNRPYQINDFCSWCALKGHGCPAWEKEQALATATTDAPAILRDNMLSILNDPDKLGRFIVAFRAFTSMYEDMKFEAVAKDMIASGEKIPGLMTYDREGKSTIDSEQFLQTIVPQMGTMRSSTCITVSAKKALETWGKFSKEPFPVPVVPGPTIKVLKENRKEIKE